jgi:hypothetical protein
LKFRSRHATIDQTPGFRLHGADAPAQQSHLERARAPDREQERAAGMIARKDLAHLKVGRVDGDDQIAGCRKINAAADGGAVHRRDHRLEVALDALPGRDVPAAIVIARLLVGGVREAQILSGAEDVDSSLNICKSCALRTSGRLSTIRQTRPSFSTRID